MTTGYLPETEAAQGLQPSPGWWRRARRERNVMIGGAIISFVAAVALLAPLLAPFPYQNVDILNSLSPPSSEHWLGTDKLGRDILSRIMVGAQVSLLVAGSVLAVTMLVGVLIGMIAGYFGGRPDGVLMRLVDMVLAFPEIVVALLVATAMGPGLMTIIISISLVWWPGIARLTRSLVIVIRNEAYVDAAIVSGTTPAGIFRRHLLPNIAAPLLVRASVGVGYIILAEATLSFLGLGIQEPTPSWGSMIRDGLSLMRTDPYLALFTSFALCATVVGFNLLGDGLRDMLDPKLKGR